MYRKANTEAMSRLVYPVERGKRMVLVLGEELQRLLPQEEGMQSAHSVFAEVGIEYKKILEVCAHRGEVGGRPF